MVLLKWIAWGKGVLVASAPIRTLTCLPRIYMPKTSGIKLHIVDFGASEQTKSLQSVGQAAEFKFQSKFKPLQVIWQSFPKAVPENNRRFWVQNQMPSSWGSTPAQVWLVGVASMNSGSFLVGGSRCGPRQVRLKKTCCHSCNTESLLTKFKS